MFYNYNYMTFHNMLHNHLHLLTQHQFIHKQDFSITSIRVHTHSSIRVHTHLRQNQLPMDGALVAIGSFQFFYYYV
jgi:hypothetical protein